MPNTGCPDLSLTEKVKVDSHSLTLQCNTSFSISTLQHLATSHKLLT